MVLRTRFLRLPLARLIAVVSAVLVAAVSAGPVDAAVAPSASPGRLAAGSAQSSSEDSPGVVRAGTWYLRNTNTTGAADVTFPYGNAGDIPVTGDWNGDGTATPGVVRAGTWYLANSTNTGTADVTFRYGDPADIPVVGDWNGDGTPTPGVVRAGIWYLRNSNTTGTADVVFAYGNPGDIPVVGDWDGDGTDTPGVVRAGTWYLRNSTTPGTADLSFAYGNAGDRAVAGDWNGDGTATPGVVRAGTWYLRDTNTTGTADVSFRYGNPGDIPVVGNWPVTAQPVSCTNPDVGYRVVYPAGWQTNAGGVLPPCSAFDPQPIQLEPDTQIPLSIAVVIREENVAFEQASTVDSQSERQISRRELTVDGRAAVVIEAESTGGALLPAGTLSYRYVVDLGGSSLVAVTYSLGELPYEQKKQVLDDMIASLEFTDGDGGTDPIGEARTTDFQTEDFPSAGGDVRLLTDVRLGAHDGFDRVVFEFDEDVQERPSFRIDYVQPPYLAAGSGQPIDLDAPVALRITMSPASGVDLSGSEPVRTYTGPERISLDGNVVNEVVQRGDFEAQLSWLVGLDGHAPYSFGVLQNPLRLVVDVRTP